MQVNKKNLEKSQIEFEVTLNFTEFKPYFDKAITKISEQVKVEGFRPGKAPYELLKQKVGEMAILEEAANIAIRSTIDKLLDDHLKEDDPAGQPQVEIIKLAPENDFIYKIKMSILPKVELVQYKDLKIKEDEVKVEDSEVEKTLEQLREMKAKESASSEKANKGDKLLVDISIFLNKVPVEDGQSKDVNVILGKEYFLPGFDDKLLGLKKDEEKEFSLVYPKEHHQSNLAGKQAEFKIKVKEVYKREVPELDDSFAQSLQFKSIDDLKKAARENVVKEKEKNVNIKNEKNLMEKLIELNKFDDIPEDLVKNEAEGMLKEMERNIEAQGAKIDDYLKHIKKTKDQLIIDFMPDATKRIKIALLLKEVAKIEKIEVNEEEIDNKLNELKKAYAGQKEAEEQLSSPDYKRHLAHSLLSEKIVKKLKEWNYVNSGKK